MKTCKSCQTQIADKAKKCPHCQADQRNWFKRHPILTAIFGIIMFFMIVGAIGSAGKSGTSTPTDNASVTTQPKVAPMVVDATSLVGEYDKNKLSAQDKYTGKVIQTTAFVDNISSDIVGSYYISLKPSNDQYYMGTSMQCYFNDKNQLTSLAKGQSVTVIGTMQDMSLGIVGMC